MNRRIKIFFGISVGLYMLLICVNNIMDYGVNFQFVSKVSAMDDVFSRGKNGWRSIRSPLFQHFMYLVIIAWEVAITILILYGVVKMLGNFKGNATAFRKSGTYLRTGLFMGVILWFSFFVTIGGEWFLMWQSKTWNGQLTAFLLTICFLLFLIHQGLPDE